MVKDQDVVKIPRKIIEHLWEMGYGNIIKHRGLKHWDNEILLHSQSSLLILSTGNMFHYCSAHASHNICNSALLAK